MVYKILSVNDIDNEMSMKYLSMMSDLKKNKMLDMKDKFRATQLFLGEILARQCLSELCDAPEFSFKLLINPDSKSIVSNFSANISVSTSGKYVACCASKDNVGISINEPVPFTFTEAQKILSDVEMRYLYSFSKYSFVDNITKVTSDEDDVMKKYAMMLSLKNACFYASGRGIRSSVIKNTFDFSDGRFICSDNEYNVVLSEFSDEKNLACAIVERRKL